MKRLLLAVAALGISASPAPAVDFYISPDVPTDDPAAAAATYQPYDVVRVSSPANTYALTTSLPPGTPVDALHRMCSGDWLLSVEAPTDLGGSTYEPYDVVRWDGAAAYALFFCGGPFGIPSGSEVDAAFLDDGDASDLILSFDVPTDLTALGGGVYDPADLVRLTRAGAGCAGWAIVGAYFDASVAVPPVPLSSNVSGADQRAGLTVLTFDVPTTLGGSTYVPGELVSWNGAAFASYHLDAAWPISSRADALAFLADPGTVPSTPPYKIHVDKAASFPPTITIRWSASSSAGVEDYAIYEGTIGTWYSHTLKVNSDSGADLQEDVNPQAASSYYLVVAYNANDEGSYGKDSNGVERPPGTVTVKPTQSLGCP